MSSEVRRSSAMLIFLLFLAASFNILSIRGATYTVGDNVGWILSVDSTNWAQGKEFHVGDILVFNYEKDLHNVMQVNSTAYEGCIKDTYIRLFTSGNDSVVLAEAGNVWYICGVNDHCTQGQKLSINVIL